MSAPSDSPPSPPPVVHHAGRSSGGRFRWLALLVLLPCLGAVVGLLVGAVVAYVSPKKFESTAVLQIHQQAQDLDAFGGRVGEGPTGASERGQFLSTQIEVIVAPRTLKRVVDRLDLSSRWNGMASEQVVEVLRGIVRSEPVPGTDLVRIRVRHPSPQDARDIADAVARAYADRRTEEERDRAERALNALDTEVRLQEDLVEEKRKLFHTIVKAAGIPYIEEAPGSGRMGQMEERILESVFRDEAVAAARKAVLEAEIEALLQLTDEELLHYLVLSERAPILQEKLEVYTAKENELELKRGELTEDDPALRTLRREVEILRSETQKGVARYKEKLQTDLQLLDSELQKKKEIVEVRRDDAVDKALQSQDYLEAKQDYESAKKLLEHMKLQHSAKRIALKVPKLPVTVHEEPLLGKAPASPHVEGLLIGGLALGAAAGLLLALLIAALMALRG